jgi:hypothetical protein
MFVTTKIKISTTILPVVLYYCKGKFENKLLRKIHGPKTDKVVHYLRALYSKNICDLYISFYAVRESNQNSYYGVDMELVWGKQETIQYFGRETSWKVSTPKDRRG